MPSSPLTPGMAGGYSALSPLPVGGRRRKSHKKTLRLVKKSTVRNMLKKKGMKMRGGGENDVSASGTAGTPTSGGRRHSRRRSHRRGMFSKLGF